MLLELLFVIITSNHVLGSDKGGDVWNYRTDGPRRWSSLGFLTCGSGSSQSPINIDTQSVKIQQSLRVTYLYGYSEAVKTMVVNNGYYVMAEPSEGRFQVRAPCAWDGQRTHTWTLQQFHWHWGGNDAVGSEHTLDTKRYPMEMHVVHYNSKYRNYGEAIKHTDGVLVLGFFIDVNSKTLTNVHAGTITEPTNPQMQPIVSTLTSNRSPVSNGTTTIFKLYELISNSVEDPAYLYFYQGSFTTPGCDEVVTWIIYKRPILVSETQLDAFRNLHFTGASKTESQEMVDNFRPTQPLNGRTVYSNRATASHSFSLCVTAWTLSRIFIAEFL